MPLARHNANPCYNQTMKAIKKLLRPLAPKKIINAYHYVEAIGHATRYHHPTRKMVTIGIVGSKGKTTTANLLWAALSASGAKVGQTGTANFRIGEHEELNPYHMTMPGPAIMQRYLKQMRDAGCEYVIVETPSEGMAQWRHVGIDYDVLVFTNVTNEIVAAHGNSLERLRADNERVFKALYKTAQTTHHGKEIPKIIITNADAEDAPRYAAFPADRHTSYGVKNKADYQAQKIKSSKDGLEFSVSGDTYSLALLGEVNVSNATAAIAVARELGVEVEAIQRGFATLGTIPGRMEVIEEGQNFTVIVDYAHEETGMQALMDGAKNIVGKGGKIITLLGGEGGGRDVKKRPIMGEIVGKTSDYVVVSNVDPYKDDPMTIIEDIAKGARKAGKKDDKDLFCIADRREGIGKALSLAKKGDLVLITGKGAEQSIVIDGQSSPWDDREVVREELSKLA